MICWNAIVKVLLTDRLPHLGEPEVNAEREPDSIALEIDHIQQQVTLHGKETTDAREAVKFLG